MKVTMFGIADAAFERSPGQDGDIFTGNLADERHGGPITVGYGRYGPDARLEADIVVDDVMIILEGRLTVSSDAGASPMPSARSPFARSAAQNRWNCGGKFGERKTTFT